MAESCENQLLHVKRVRDHRAFDVPFAHKDEAIDFLFGKKCTHFHRQIVPVNSVNPQTSAAKYVLYSGAKIFSAYT